MTSPLAHSIPTTHPHDDIARQAYQLWQERGWPTGCDDEIWLETERRMNEDQPGARSTEDTKSPTSSDHPASRQAAPTLTEKDASLDAVKKQNARAPQVPHHTAPTIKPAVTGKPVWPKSHSS